MRRVIDLPLHNGRAPTWLVKRMNHLSGAIVSAIVFELGPNELLKRLANPLWFQSLGCLLGFDWHSSGLTTTVTAALKRGIKGMERELGIYITGGKGRFSLKTPEEIESWSHIAGTDGEMLKNASKYAAKTDSSLVQDGYKLYHHTFIFTDKNKWVVIQQGMNMDTHYARRYHWHSDTVKSFHNSPHTGIISNNREKDVLCLTDKKSHANKQGMVSLSAEHPYKLLKEFIRIKSVKFPRRHWINPVYDISQRNLYRIFEKTYNIKPENFFALYTIKGVGEKTIRALSMLSEIITGKSPSFNDPVMYTYTHGGKDGFPYPVNKAIYDNSISVLEHAIKRAKMGRREELNALHRLGLLFKSD